MTACEWPVDFSACMDDDNGDGDGGGVPAVWEDVPESAQKTFTQMAIDLLNAWTDHRFGVCSYTYRPRPSKCRGRAQGSTYWGRSQVLGPPVTRGCQACGKTSCESYFSDTVRLPRPVVELQSVWVDGVELDPSEYVLLGTRRVRRVSGEPWPTTQAQDLPLTEPGTWGISYRGGREVPKGGQIAAGRLAVELWKAACGDTTCALPERVQTISRQGVTVGVAIDTFEDINEGRTGIWIVDSWVASVSRAPVRVAIGSPDWR